MTYVRAAADGSQCGRGRGHFGRTMVGRSGPGGVVRDVLCRTLPDGTWQPDVTGPSRWDCDRSCRDLPAPGVFSPHRPYRVLLSRCFIVRRTSGGEVEPVEEFDSILLSSLIPGNDNPAAKFPALLICAAANVSDRGVTPAGSNVLPLVVTSENVSIPGHPAATIPTTGSSRRSSSQERATRLVPKKPMISLARAIALTGAAISPSMGRLSRPRLRPVLAALNARLGAWIPNPLSGAARRAVENGNSDPFTVGVDQLIWEFLGRNPARSQLLYVSDGGH